MTRFTTITELLGVGADTSPAILSTEGPNLSFAGLRGLAQATVARLNGLGIGRGDRVAISLPNGPEMAAAFVAIGAGATTAPLNPAYRHDEFAFYLGDLGAKALVVAQGVESPARAVAAELGIAIIELIPEPERGAGSFRLETYAPEQRAARPGFAEATDQALVLHTSGTTARPKIVPLSQTNITASARHIGETLALTPNDLCLNIMPLFHIHGLIAAVLSSLGAGAGVCCTPGFNALKFFGWLEAIKPTWYTAVPTMHQAILARAGRNADALATSRLRLIRSSSASLPPQVMLELESVFRAPVIESYGMTEAAHQMASNQLPPGLRKPGAVGRAAGPEVAVMDDDGTILPKGGVGEVVIRGPNVTAGYESNPEANAKAFTNGWFRTGDQGRFDEDGYLFLTGRLKEQINCGGEKISPLEIDVALLDHPAVAQVVTFGVPHDKLGETVAAAIVLAEGATLTEHELKAFAAERLADFKVPRRVIFLAEIPKGATGKVQRIGLADKLADHLGARA